MATQRKKIGSRREVYDGIAKQTSGGLTKKQLALSSRTGKVVSVKKQQQGRGRVNNLGKHLQQKSKN